MLNGASFSANKFGTFFFFLYAVFFVPNYLLFLWQDRFFEIVRKPVSGLHTAFVLIYVVGTISIYVLTR
jgi:hypothetical protein